MPAKKNVVELTEEELGLLGIDYVGTKAQIKTLDEHCKEIRKSLESYIDSNGRTLDSGSVVAIVRHADKEVFLRKTLRVSKVLLPEAESVLRKQKLEAAIEMVPVIREDVIERLYEEGKISSELLCKLYAEKSTFAFSVSLKPIVDEEE